MSPSTLSAASDRSSEVRSLDCAYGDLIFYQNLPSNDLGGINSLYQSSYLAHRDTEFIRAYTGSNHHNHHTLYKFYTSAIAQCSWPELADLDNDRATWLVRFIRPHWDSGFTVARTMVALDPRWSLVGLLSFGDLGIVLQRKVTAREARDLHQGVFPSGLLKFGNPTTNFRAMAWLLPADEVGDDQQEQPQTRAEFSDRQEIDESSSETSRGVSRGLSSRSDNHSSYRVTEVQHHTSPTHSLPPLYQGPSDQRCFVPRTYTHLSTIGNDHGSTRDDIPSASENNIAIDIVNNADTIHSQSNSPSEEDEEVDILPSYHHASRRLARHQRLLAEDPLDIEDPAGALHPTEEEIEDLDHFEVPPTYHDRGEAAPDYLDSTDNDRARDEEGRGSESLQRDSVLPATHGIFLPAYEDVLIEILSAHRASEGDSELRSETALASIEPSASGPAPNNQLSSESPQNNTAPIEAHRAPAPSIPNLVPTPTPQTFWEIVEDNATWSTAPSPPRPTNTEHPIPTSTPSPPLNPIPTPSPTPHHPRPPLHRSFSSASTIAVSPFLEDEPREWTLLEAEEWLQSSLRPELPTPRWPYFRSTTGSAPPTVDADTDTRAEDLDLSSGAGEGAGSGWLRLTSPSGP
ncbi:MAG: hypothetical protein Q9195_007544 [Heterodermia aff. obscurata]